jgi:5-methylcytosine-specific restriction protein A
MFAKVCACGQTVAAGFRCGCTLARKPDHRPNAAARGYDHAWSKLRAQHLALHPLCIRCNAPAVVVDHVKTVRSHPHLRLDPSNLQSLCRSHHSGWKQSLERRGAGDDFAMGGSDHPWGIVQQAPEKPSSENTPTFIVI